MEHPQIQAGTLPCQSTTRNILRYLIENYWGVFALLAAWQLWVFATQFNPIVIPRPLAVLKDILSAPEVYATNTALTVGVAIVGLVGGVAVGSMLAIAAWSSRIAAGMLTPITVIFSSVPVVALIPVIARLLGYDVSTVLAIVIIISFFPSFVFMSAGLRALPAGAGDLFRVFGANRMRTLIHLALPAAMPNLAIAFRLAAAQCILAAMVAEFLMGTSGLGYLFHVTKANFDTERAFGASLVATVISVVMFLLANRIEKSVRDRWT